MYVLSKNKLRAVVPSPIHRAISINYNLLCPSTALNVHFFHRDEQKALAEVQHRSISEYLSLQVLLDGCEGVNGI